MVNCNECKHISITEEEQKTNKYKDHRCNLHYIQVRHRSSNYKAIHDFIHPCGACKGLDFKKR